MHNDLHKEDVLVARDAAGNPTALLVGNFSKADLVLPDRPFALTRAAGRWAACAASQHVRASS